MTNQMTQKHWTTNHTSDVNEAIKLQNEVEDLFHCAITEANIGILKSKSDLVGGKYLKTSGGGILVYMMKRRYPHGEYYLYLVEPPLGLRQMPISRQ